MVLKNESLFTFVVGLPECHGCTFSFVIQRPRQLRAGIEKNARIGLRRLIIQLVLKKTIWYSEWYY